MTQLEGAPTHREKLPALTISRAIRRIASRVFQPARSHGDSVPQRFPHGEITWKCSQRVVWIATHATEYVGVVEEHDGMYVANDSMRGTYNTYRTLADAMQAFEIPIGNAFAA